MVLCLGEPLRRFLLLFIHFCSPFFLLLLLLLFISFLGCFAMSPALHPGFSGPWRPPPALSSTPTTFDCLCFFIYRERYSFEWPFFSHRHFLPYAPSPTTFNCLCFFIYREHYSFEWAFFTHRRFLSYAPSPTTFNCLCFFIYCEHYSFEWAFFTHRRFLPYAPSLTTCVYQGFPGSWQFLLQVWRISY